MGVLPLDERYITIDGRKWQLDATTTTDDMSRSDGTIQVLVRPKGSSDWTHCCHAPVEHGGTNFIDRFVSAFVANKEFRELCEIKGDGSSQIDHGTNFGEKTPKIPAAPAPKSSSHIDRLIKMGKSAKFKDYASLKSGRDQFSSKNEKDLRTLLGGEADRLDSLIEQRNDELAAGDRIKALRWMARGLPAELALRKIFTDLEISKKSRGKR